MTSQPVLRGFDINKPWDQFSLNMLSKGPFGVIGLGGKYGGFTIVDIKDFYKYSNYKWYSDVNGYIHGKINGKNVRLSRIISGAKEDEITDHINGFKHDNTSKNLRNTTYLGNAGNRRINKNKKSTLYRYIYYDKIKNKYLSQITINHKSYYLGCYNTEDEAIIAVDMFITHESIAKDRELIIKEKKEEYLKREYIPYKKIIKNVQYIGVTQRKNIYIARIRIAGKKKYIISSNDPIVCARAYDKAIVDNNIKGRKLNFPEYYSDYDIRKIKTLCEEYDEKSVKLLIKSPEICLIDKEDYEKIKYYNCYYQKKSNYVKIEVNNKTYNLSRYLLGLKDEKIYADHIERNKTDNRKEKLKESDSKKNGQNKSKCISKITTSKYLGVYFDKEKSKWRCTVTFEGKTKNIATVKTELIAAKLRDIYIINYLSNEHYPIVFRWTNQEKIKWSKILEKHLDGTIKKLVNKNHKKIQNTSSKYIGVSFNNQSNNWITYVTFNKKRIFQKTVDNEETAAKLRDIYIIEYLSDQGYRLNFYWTKTEKKIWKEKLIKILNKN